MSTMPRFTVQYNQVLPAINHAPAGEPNSVFRIPCNKVASGEVENAVFRCADRKSSNNGAIACRKYVNKRNLNLKVTVRNQSFFILPA